MVCVLLGFGPIQRGPEGSNGRPTISLEVTFTVRSILTYKSPIPTKQQASRPRDLLVALNVLDDGKETGGNKCYSGERVKSISSEVSRLCEGYNRYSLHSPARVALRFALSSTQEVIWVLEDQLRLHCCPGYHLDRFQLLRAMGGTEM